MKRRREKWLKAKNESTKRRKTVKGYDEKTKSERKRTKFIQDLDNSEMEMAFKIYKNKGNLDEIEFIEYEKIVSLAELRQYPFIEEARVVLDIYKGIKPLISIINRIRDTFMNHLKFMKPPKCLIKSRTRINKCNIVNIHRLRKMYYDKWPNDRKFDRVLTMNNKFHLCMHHVGNFHICENYFCMRKEVTREGTVCRISGNRTETFASNIYDAQCGSAIFNKKSFIPKAFKTFHNFLYTTQDGTILELGNLPNMLSNSLYKECMVFKDLSDYMKAQIDFYKKLIETNVTFCGKQLKKKSRKKKKKKKGGSKNVTKRGGTTSKDVDNDDESGGGGRKKQNKTKTQGKIIQRRRKSGKSKKKRDRGEPKKNNSHRVVKSKSTKNFVIKETKLFQIIERVNEIKHFEVMSITHAIKRFSYENSESEFYPSKSRDSRYVNPHRLGWDVSLGNLQTGIEFDDPIMFYLWFLDLSEIKEIIEVDRNSITSLRDPNHPWIRNSNSEFKTMLPNMVKIIKKLCPGLYRLIMIMDTILNECKTKLSELKSILKESHTNQSIVNTSDIDHLLKYHYEKYYLHKTISDELVLEIAEIMYWCRKQCETHPRFSECNQPEMNEDVIYIGCLYLLQGGLGNIIPKHPLLSNRWFLAPKNKTGLFIAEPNSRSDVSTGRLLVKQILCSKCKIMPFERVSFMMWKRNHSELSNM